MANEFKKLVAKRSRHTTEGAVAGKATVGQANRKQRGKLEARRADWSKSMDTKNASAGGVQQRKEAGGFKRPGSYSK